MGDIKKVMIVQYHENSLNMLKNMFNGYEVKLFISSSCLQSEMVEQMKKFNPDLLITALLLGESSMLGLDVVRLYRCLFPSLRIIVYTHCVSRESIKLSTKAGANKFISKFDDKPTINDFLSVEATDSPCIPEEIRNRKEKSHKVWKFWKLVKKLLVPKMVE